MNPEIDTTNKFCVASNGRNLVLLNPPLRPFTPEEALVFAAYLVLMAGPFASFSFEEAKKAVENT